jgi:hypothetical protein
MTAVVLLPIQQPRERITIWQMLRCPFSLQQYENVMDYGFPSESKIKIKLIHINKDDDRCIAEMSQSKKICYMHFNKKTLHDHATINFVPHLWIFTNSK